MYVVKSDWAITVRLIRRLRHLQMIIPGMRGYVQKFCELAEEYWKLKKYDKAKALYQYVSQNSSDSNVAIKAQKMAAIMEIWSGDITAADEAVEKLKDDFAGHPQLCQHIHEIAMKCWFTKNFDLGKDLYYYVSQNSTDKEIAFCSLNRALKCELRLGNYTAAEAGIDELIADFSENPKLDDVLYSLGNDYWRVEKYEEARGLFNYIAEQFPESSFAFRGQSRIIRAYWQYYYTTVF